MKKTFKKLLALVVAMTMVMAMGMTAFATEGEGGEGETPAAATSGAAGGTGSITVKNATSGHDYKAYKVFDASFDGENVSYKVLAELAGNVDTDYFTVSTSKETIDGKEYYSVSRKMVKNEETGEMDPAKTDAEVIDWVKANYSKFDSTGVSGTWDATDSTVTFNNLPYGYYYITSSLGTAVTINSAVPTQDVYDKNSVEPEDPVKNVVSVDGEVLEDPAKSADAHVGSVVGFKITAKTTNWIGKEAAATIREKWEVTDTPTNMTVDENSIVVKFNNTELTKGTDYTATIGTDGKLTINVPMVDEDGNSIFKAPKTTDEENGLIPIEITYSATITATAGSAPAKNEIPGDDIVKVYTYAFQVAKTDGTDPLPGAQFELWSAKDGETAAALTFIDNGDGTYTYSADGTVTTLDMTTNTTIVVKGLDKAWTYTLKETKVPDGYNQAADITVAGSSLTKVEDNTDTSVTSTALYKETVENLAGAVLPTTGGMGTTIFYALGAVLVLGAGVLMVTRRRMAN